MSLTEKRSSLRHPTEVVGGQIHYMDQTADCTVRNLSLTGACLRGAGYLDLEAIPNRFALLIKGAGSYEKCRVIWRSATEIGVKFE
jgi:hypothetical protein